LLAIAINVSKKLVSMGRKFYYFVYYVELINIKLWMAEEVVALNGGLESKTVEGMIRKGLGSNACDFFFFHHQFSEDGRFGLLKLIVVIFDFHYTNDCTMASNMSLLGIDLIRG
jgi:hypothetical protein